MVYERTVPRVPVMATFSGPGPVVYPLPTLVGQKGHDPRTEHEKAPAWPFGVKHGKFFDDCSPGPVHYPDVTVTRRGKDGTPHFSLHSRPLDPTNFHVPGPGAYSPEKSGPSANYQSPRFSFGHRNRLRASDKNPGIYLYTSCLNVWRR